MFRFSPAVAPVKVTVFPLLQKEDLNRPAQQIATALKAEGLSVVIDTTGACPLNQHQSNALVLEPQPAAPNCCMHSLVRVMLRCQYSCREHDRQAVCTHRRDRRAICGDSRLRDSGEAHGDGAGTGHHQAGEGCIRVDMSDTASGGSRSTAAHSSCISGIW